MPAAAGGEEDADGIAVSREVDLGEPLEEHDEGWVCDLLNLDAQLPAKLVLRVPEERPVEMLGYAGCEDAVIPAPDLADSGFAGHPDHGQRFGRLEHHEGDAHDVPALPQFILIRVEGRVFEDLDVGQVLLDEAQAEGDMAFETELEESVGVVLLDVIVGLGAAVYCGEEDFLHRS